MKVSPNSKPGVGAAACIAVLAAGIVVAACDPATGPLILDIGQSGRHARPVALTP